MYSYFNHQLILIPILPVLNLLNYYKEELEFQLPLNM